MNGGHNHSHDSGTKVPETQIILANKCLNLQSTIYTMIKIKVIGFSEVQFGLNPFTPTIEILILCSCPPMLLMILVLRI